MNIFKKKKKKESEDDEELTSLVGPSNDSDEDVDDSLLQDLDAKPDDDNSSGPILVPGGGEPAYWSAAEKSNPQYPPGKHALRIKLDPYSGVGGDITRAFDLCIRTRPYQMSPTETIKFLSDWEKLQKTDTKTDWKKKLKEEPGLIPTLKKGSCEVVGIDLVINRKRWAKYRAYADDGKGLQLPPRASGSKETEWSKSHDFPWLVNFKGDVIDLPICSLAKGEYFLFHGTGMQGMTGITDFGFDPSRCRKGTAGKYGSLGQGAYLSDNFAKCAAYARCAICDCCSCLCGEGALRAILVSRVAFKADKDKVKVNKLVGRRFRSVTTLQKKMEKEPATTIAEGRPDRGAVTKVLDLKFGNNDFLVYRSDMAYTEFVVWYRRLNYEPHRAFDPEIDVPLLCHECHAARTVIVGTCPQCGAKLEMP